MTVEAHLDRDTQTLNKFLNIEMDKLAGTVHFDPIWKSKPVAHMWSWVSNAVVRAPVSFWVVTSGYYSDNNLKHITFLFFHWKLKHWQ